MITSIHKGLATELRIQADFIECGCSVARPNGEMDRYDLIVDVDNRLLKVQIKKSVAISNGNAFMFDCRSNYNSRHYSKDEIDYFATCYEGRSYMVPVEECYRSKTLRLKETHYKGKSPTVMAEQYELEKVVQRIREKDYGKADSL